MKSQEEMVQEVFDLLRKEGITSDVIVVKEGLFKLMGYVDKLADLVGNLQERVASLEMETKKEHR